MIHVEPGDIAALITSGQFEEGPELEAKRAAGNIPRNVWESISAFANTAGGVVVLGLVETPEGWVVEGVGQPAQMIQSLHTAMRDREKISYEVAANDDIWTEAVDGRELIIVRVASVPKRYRPVYINGDRDQAFVRRNEGDARCTPNELDRMRREASSEPGDFRVIPYLNMDDLDLDAVERYRALCQDRSPHLPHHRLADTKDFLEAISAWRRDRQRNEEGPTFAGVLMFGKDLAIREVRPTHVIDYRRIPADETPRRRWIDRVRWTGHLFGAWEELFPRLTRGLPVPFQLRGPQRVDEPAGREALREAFVNLLVHTDYHERGDAVIFHYDDGYLFRNPGDSWVSPEDIGIPGRSERRNPTIAQMFDHARLADQAGSGFIRIFDEWRSLGYRKPRVETSAERYEFELELRLASLLAHDDRRWLSEIGGPWREEEELALVFARHQARIDNQTLRQATGQDVLGASQTLRSLSSRDYLIMHPAGRNTWYELGPAAHSGASAQLVLGEAHELSEQGKAVEDARDPAALDGVTDQSLGTWGLSLGDLDSSLRDLVESLGDSGSELVGLSEEVRTKPYVAAEALSSTIIRLCEIQPLSIRNLVTLLGRKPDHVRSVVRELVKQGRLAFEFPDRPNDPRQRYRTVAPHQATESGRENA